MTPAQPSSRQRRPPRLRYTAIAERPHRRASEQLGLWLAVLIVSASLGCDQEVRLVEIPETTQPSATVVPSESALNLLLITLDTTRADALGSFGQALQPTPTLDSLVTEGTRFTQCESASPNTLPSHATLLTGQFPFRHGARSNVHYALPDDNETLAERLQAAGYTTAAEVAADVLNRHTQLDQGFASYRDLRSPGVVTAAESLAFSAHERSASQISDRGIEFLEANVDQAFFLWLHYFDPHIDYQAPPPYAGQQETSPYHAEIQYVDAEIQRVIASIEQLELREKTLVVIVSDHGEGLNQHGEETHGLLLHESTTRVPLIFWGPDVLPKGRRIDATVRTVDVAPTILEILDLPPLAGVHGSSLMPLVRGEVDDPKRLAYGESLEARILFGAPILRFLRQGNWKYIHGSNLQLYDLGSDPDELDNLASERPEKVAELREELEALIRAQPGPALDGRRSQDRETKQKLLALGYVAGGESFTLADELAALDVEGADPSALLSAYAQLGQAEERLLAGDYPGAAQIYRGLYDQHPQSAPLLLALLTTLGQMGPNPAMIPLLWDLITMQPDNLNSHYDLARLLAMVGDDAGIEEVMGRALQIDPCSEPALTQLAKLAHARQDHREERRLLEQAVEGCDPSLDMLNNYAYLLATSPDPEVRDGIQAVETAKAVARRMDVPNPAFLDTLAAAYAEVELFETAVRAEQQAIEILEHSQAPEATIELFRQHLEQFEAETPIRSR